MTIKHDEPTVSRLPTVAADRLARFDQALAEALAARHYQLSCLPDAQDDPIVAAERGALRLTLADLAAARRRLAAGTYGTCSHCRRPIAEERLELRPWTTTCVDCGAL